MSQESKKMFHLENHVTCPICKEIFYEPRMFHCGHSVCLNCQLNIKDRTCPMCRKISDVHPNINLRNICVDYDYQRYQEQKEVYTNEQINRLAADVLQECAVLWKKDMEEHIYHERLAYVFRHWYWTIKKKEPYQLMKWKTNAIGHVRVFQHSDQWGETKLMSPTLGIVYKNQMYIFFEN